VRSYLILYRTPSELLQPPALRVLDVEEASNASRAGIQEGDYLESYNNMQPETIEALRSAIKEAEGSDRERIELVVYRGAERLVMDIAPGTLGVTLIEQ
jgi:S1-C subfamily serine protease